VLIHKLANNYTSEGRRCFKNFFVQNFLSQERTRLLPPRFQRIFWRSIFKIVIIIDIEDRKRKTIAQHTL